MADQPGDRCTASLGLGHGWQLGAASLLSKRGKGGAGVSQRVDHDCDTLCLDLDSRPSQPPDLHLVSFYRTIVRYHRSVPRRSTAAVAETRAAVTEAAVDRASVEGLEGL